MENKKTKKEMYALIAEAMADNQLVVDFCNHEIELLDKKRGSADSKKLAEREVEMKIVLDALKSCEKPVTVTELSRVNYEVGLMSPSKITSRLGMLKEAKLVDSAKDGKSNKYFVITE
jgi:DNA-binding transcriptional ArsR family regulator